MSTPELTSWNLESIRLSVFLAEQPNLAQDWWKQITGVEPEQSVHKRQTGEYSDEGTFGDWRLALNINTLAQNRVDWIAYPPAPSLIGFSHIGQYIEQSKLFFEALQGWLTDTCPPSKRIAFGAVLINELPDKKTGYQMLQSFLPIIKFDLDNWSEFFFQVNKKAISETVDGLEINKLSKWNALRLTRVIFEPTNAAPIEFHACRLELDINTSAENISPFDSILVPAIVAELRQIANRYASEGY